MKLSAALFLAGYYANNLVNCKIRGPFVRKTVREKAHEWNELREAHSGHDAWLVVGNGPSLTSEDLESLGHLPSVASNKINLLYDRTDWRPTLYTIVDAVLLHKLRSEHTVRPRGPPPQQHAHGARGAVRRLCKAGEDGAAVGGG